MIYNYIIFDIFLPSFAEIILFFRDFTKKSIQKYTVKS
jgi:hypothetical protein